MSSSTVFKTPKKCSSHSRVYTPIAGVTPRDALTTPRRIDVTPKSARAARTLGDRFVPSRAGADLQFSAYKVRSGRRRSRSASGDRKLENRLSRTPRAVSDADSERRREKLFSLRGRSSESRVLNIKQMPTTASTSKQNSGEKMFIPCANSK